MKQVSNKLRRLATTAVSAIAVLACTGQDVSYDQALNIAGDFFRANGISTSPSTMRRAKATAPLQTGNSAYYIINTDGAYAVVSGESSIGPILAYSLSAPFDADNVAPAAADILAGYEAYIKAVAAGQAQAPAPLRISIPEGKLLPTATWHQSGDPWNTYCPVVDGQRAPGGCAATAMSIIMRYHCWPTSTGYGSKTFTPVKVGTPLTANFGATDYSISTIPTDGSYYSITNTWTDAQKQAAGTLIYHAGIAANMEYDKGSSGTSDLSALVGLCRYFGYTMGGIAQLSTYTDRLDDYLQLVIDEINAGYPMPYSGYNDSNGGHMFVCDGYDTAGRLHFNFGWGYGGDYYTIFPDNHTLTYHNYQAALIGIRPNRTTEAPALYIPYVGDNYVTIYDRNQDGKIHRGETFSVKVKGLVNTSDETLNWRRSIRVCDASGNVKLTLSETTTDVSCIAGTYNTLEVPVSLPLEYNYEAGDKIVIYYSVDGGSSWEPVPCCQKDANSLCLDEDYENAIVLNMVMVTPSGETCKGLTIDTATPITADGTTFNVCTNALCNWSGFAYTGDLAIYLCDSDGEPIQMIGSIEVTTALRNNYYNDFTVPCSIPAGTTLHRGDRLIAYARYTGEETWCKVGCSVDEKGYILIPEELCEAPATGETVTFTTLMATYSSANDIDFSSATDFYAFKVVPQDRETLILQRIYELKAGEGALLWGKNKVSGKYTDTVTYKEGAAANTDNLLVGVLTDTAITNDGASYTNYIFKATDQEIGFYVAAGETVAAGQAYMRIGGSPSGAPARFTFFMTDDTSGIISITADQAPEDNTIYNLQGIKVTSPTNGIYIMNGKKVIIRM